MIFSDKTLSIKLERAEALVNADLVETRARLEPASGAEWIEVAGTYAMFDDVDSPCTQTFGLGMFDEITDAELSRIEGFFVDLGAPVFHEVSPMADPLLLPLLNSRGYQPVEFTSVMFTSLDRPANVRGRVNPEITTRVIEADEVALWARTSADGWATEGEGLGDFMLGFASIGARCKTAFPYLAELNGRPISTGTLFIQDDVAFLAGASTIPDGRNKGAQTALLGARLRFAAEQGCQLAVMGASPGSQSQINAQRNGFNIAYTRTKWQLMDT